MLAIGRALLERLVTGCDTMPQEIDVGFLIFVKETAHASRTL
jgi:hypothetical protein